MLIDNKVDRYPDDGFDIKTVWDFINEFSGKKSQQTGNLDIVTGYFTIRALSKLYHDIPEEDNFRIVSSELVKPEEDDNPDSRSESDFREPCSVSWYDAGQESGALRCRGLHQAKTVSPLSLHRAVRRPPDSGASGNLCRFRSFSGAPWLSANNIYPVLRNSKYLYFISLHA